MSAVVLLDRDGVLNRDLPGSVTTVEDLSLVPGAERAVALLSRAGYAVLVITNQAAVGRGQLSPAELARINDRLAAWISAGGGRLDRFYVCPLNAQEGCSCRKPRPGLIEQAAGEWGFARAQTWFVGDAERDVAAARAAGCRPALVRTGKGAAAAAQLPGVPAFDDLLAFATALTGGVAPPRSTP